MHKRNALIYLIGTCIEKGVPFLLVPVYTRIMPIEEYGKYGAYVAFLGILALGIGLKPEGYLIKCCNENKEQRLHNIIIACFMLVPLTLIVLAPVSYLFTQLFFDGTETKPLEVFLLSITASTLIALQVIPESLLQVKGKAFWLVNARIVSTFSAALLSILLLIFVDTSWHSRALAEIFSSFLALLMVGGVLKENRGLINWREIKREVTHAVVFLFPLLGHVTAFAFMNIGDRLIIQKLADIEDVGRYTAAYTLGMIIGVLHEGLLRAWSPYFFANVTSSRENELRVFKHASIYAVASLLVGGIMGVVFANIYQWILPSDYRQIGFVIFVVSIAYSLEGARKVFCSYLYLANKTKLIAVVSIICAFLNVFLNILMIPMYGIDGAALATLISFSLMMTATLYYGIRERKQLLMRL